MIDELFLNECRKRLKQYQTIEELPFTYKLKILLALLHGSKSLKGIAAYIGYPANKTINLIYFRQRDSGLLKEGFIRKNFKVYQLTLKGKNYLYKVLHKM